MTFMKILIISFFNSSNLGDCVLSNSLYEHFAGNYICEKISYALNPFQYTDMNEVKDIICSGNAHIKSRIIDYLSKLHLLPVIYFYYKHKELFPIEIKERVKRLIEDSELIIIGGGNMVFDLFPTTLSAARLDYYIKMAKKLKKKVFVCSVGIGPFSNKKQIKSCIDVLEKADYLSFRDSYSEELFRKNSDRIKNVVLSADPAFWKIDGKLHFLFNGSIAVNIIDPKLFTKDVQSIEKISKNYRDLIHRIAEKFSNKKIIIFTTERRDMEFAKKIFEETESDNISFQPISAINSLYELYEKTFVVIGSRMHSVITAFSYGVPVIGLSWQEKMNSLFQLLELENYLYDIKNLDINRVVKSMINLYEKEQSGNMEREFQSRFSKIQKLLEQNDKIADELLKNEI